MEAKLGRTRLCLVFFLFLVFSLSQYHFIINAGIIEERRMCIPNLMRLPTTSVLRKGPSWSQRENVLDLPSMALDWYADEIFLCFYYSSCQTPGCQLLGRVASLRRTGLHAFIGVFWIMYTGYQYNKIHGSEEAHQREHIFIAEKCSNYVSSPLLALSDQSIHWIIWEDNDARLTPSGSQPGVHQNHLWSSDRSLNNWALPSGKLWIRISREKFKRLYF